LSIVVADFLLLLLFFLCLRPPFTHTRIFFFLFFFFLVVWLITDNRLGVLLFIIAPALGWVGFNSIAGLQRQVNNMAEKNEKNKR